MSTHLQKITTKAKQLRKAHPNMKWTSLIKLAAKKVKPAAKKRAAPKKRVVRKKAAAPKKIKVSKTVTRRTTASVGSVASMTARLKSMLLEDLGRLEIRKFQARLKRDKTKIQKLITAKKSQLRRLAK